MVGRCAPCAKPRLQRRDMPAVPVRKRTLRSGLWKWLGGIRPRRAWTFSGLRVSSGLKTC